MQSGTRYGRVGSVVLGVAWVAAIGLGLLMMTDFQWTAGASGTASPSWPAGTRLPPPAGNFRLVLILQPHCPCGRASITELERILARCDGSLEVDVVLVTAATEPGSWEAGAIHAAARELPKVRIHVDPDGTDAAAFGGRTSGAALLFGPEGALLFEGGITPARGHIGANPGAEAVVVSVRGGVPCLRSTPTYGCPLGDLRPRLLGDGR